MNAHRLNEAIRALEENDGAGVQERHDEILEALEELRARREQACDPDGLMVGPMLRSPRSR